ncbi:hypothetical protein Hanom_Chr10g00918311 [Helianthus anomalus]
MLLITHKLTAISNPTPLLSKASDSSKIMPPAYLIPNNSAIARSCTKRHDKNYLKQYQLNRITILRL